MSYSPLNLLDMFVVQVYLVVVVVDVLKTVLSVRLSVEV